VNRLPPLGSSCFSVGAGVPADDVGATDVVVVVVVVLDGLSFALVPQPAVNAPIAMMAAPPATTPRRRLKRRDSITCKSYLYPALRRFSGWVRERVDTNIDAANDRTVNKSSASAIEKNTVCWDMTVL
jgi:hypothetical protein